jgi:CelD/BcsL family acetyltransferase involved in cellulose biosynthesis
MIRLDVVRGPELFPRLRDEWTRLSNGSEGGGPFQTWEWQSIWFRHLGRGRTPLAFTVREGNDLVGLMTFVITGGPWRVLRPLGIGPSDYLQPLAREGSEEAVAEAIAEALEREPAIDLVDLQQLRETQPLATRCRTDLRTTQATCLVLDLPKTYDEYLKCLGKSLRYDVKKLDKTLFSDGRAEIRAVARDQVQKGFDAFLELHRARWRKRHLPGAFIGRIVDFHREWIEAASERGWLRMSLLDLDGQLAGAIYALSHGRTVYYYQAGFDPDRSSVSPGTLLVAHTIRKSIEEGAVRFDFMRGDEPYKRRWKAQHVWRNERLLLARNPVRGFTGLKWNQMSGTVEARIRARLEGHGASPKSR